MRRREFLGVLSGAATWPVLARAQQSQDVKLIGVLSSLAAQDREGQRGYQALLQALSHLGWVDGRNARIEIRWAAGDQERFRKYGAELVALAPDIIVAVSPPAVFAVQEHTSVIPIVFMSVGDPVGYGIIASMAKPGGNVTGVANFGFAMGGKWIEVLKEIAPEVAHVAFLYHPTTTTKGYEAYLKSVISAAPTFGISIKEIALRDESEIEPLMSDFARDTDRGLIVPPDPFSAVHRLKIINVAERLRLPAVYPFSYFVESGGLVSYGVNRVEQVEKVAAFVNRILRGEKPADLPAEGPTKFEMFINAKAAKALGLSIPPTLLARADVVIE